MLTTVTNRSQGARGFATLDRGTVAIEPGSSALLDLADHPLHRAWAEEGAVTLLVLPDKDAKAARRRLDVEEDAGARMRREALAALPEAAGPEPG